MVRLDIDVRELKRARVLVSNERLLLQRAAAKTMRAINTRLMFGHGSRGALPKPKDGGAPYRRSGQLAGSAVASVRERKPTRKQSRTGMFHEGYEGVVQPGGRRTDADRKTALASTKQSRRRAEYVVAVTLSELLTGKTARYHSKSKAGNLGRIKVGHIRNRAIHTNYALAAVLARPPTDANSRKGNRGQYHVFETTHDDATDLARLIETQGDWELVPR